MSQAARTRHVWTYADYARFPEDGNRYEVLDGEVLVTPAPSTLHQHVAGNLYIVLREYVENHDLGYVLFDVDLLFASGQFLRPDLLYVPKRGRDGITNRGVEVTPDLVVEVLSPASRRNDRVKKPPRYADFGVPEYWAVDPDDRVVWVHDFGGPGEPEGHADQLAWQPSPAAPPLEIDVPAVLRPL